MRCMVLNQDYQLLDIANWTDALHLVLDDKATAIAHYDEVIHSAYNEYQLPAVMVMNYYIRSKKKNKMFSAATKRNVFVRDNFICMYCGIPVTLNSGTLDHVIPTCRGGPNVITNVVCSCKTCNNRKDDKTAEEYYSWVKKTKAMDPENCKLSSPTRSLTEEEKIRVLLKKFKSKERKVWLKCLKDKGISLW